MELKFKYIVTIIALSLGSFVSSYSEKLYQDGELYVKFAENSDLYSNWLKNGRSGETQKFGYVLGRHSAKAAVNDGLLRALSGKITKSPAALRESSDGRNTTANLRRICLIEYDNEVPPAAAAAKISGFEGVEYAEPVPVKKLFAVPNDTLLHFQYYLSQIKVFSAWDLIETDSSITIGVVDTGLDFDHEDLKDKIWTNPGETGIDADGKDKSSNGKDDDGNGYIDDWRGWDFVSSSYPEGDNDPSPGHVHGTHVSGICAASADNVRGIAGVSPAAKILTVKVGADNPFSTNVEHSYEGVLYAALLGADIINCSWGNSSRSESEMEMLEAATEAGSLIIAAAGNDGQEVAFFPAAHEDVLSVSAVNFDDEKAGFSNFDYTVDIAAPGVDIFSTIPGNGYDYLSGTSMAAPVVAGTAALVRQKFPDYSPLQTREWVKASSDNIDSANPYLLGKMGKGRVNVYKALKDTTYKSIVLLDYNVSGENDDGILDAEEKITLSINVVNALAEVSDARAEITVYAKGETEYINREVEIGPMTTLQTARDVSPLSFIIPENIPTDYKLPIEILFFDGEEYLGGDFITLICRPSYRTMNANNITVTFNARGNIAFNDYPTNFQGEGFKYKDGINLLYEGSLMIGAPPGKVSNVARGSNQMTQDRSFYSNNSFRIKNPGDIAQEEGSVTFYSDSSDVTISTEVKHKAYQFTGADNEDFVISVYDIFNTSSTDYDSLFVGIYFDWDIGAGGQPNIGKFDDQYGFGYVKNIAVPEYRLAGAAMLSSHKLNFFAIDNGGTTKQNPGVWDGYTRMEKWLTLSSGIYRKESNVTDASIVISAGPIKLNAGDSARVAFSLFAGADLEELREHFGNSSETALEYDIANGKFNPLPIEDSIVTIYPNPNYEEKVTVEYILSNPSYISIDIFNALGRKTASPITERYVTAGVNEDSFELSRLAQGRYYIRISTNRGILVEPFEVVK